MVSVDDIRDLALSLPEAVEVEHWGKASFRVNNKIFAVIQEDGITLTIKTSAEEREIYTSMSPETYKIPETFSNLNYMHMNLELVAFDELRELLIKAWSSVAPKRIVKAYYSELE